MKPTNKKNVILIVGLVACLPASLSAATLTYTTGLDVWLDASDIDGSGNSTFTDGDSVATWKNKGTTGVNDAVAILTGSGQSAGSNPGVFVSGGGIGPQDAVRLNNTRFQFGQEFMDSPNFTAFFVVQRIDSNTVGTLFNDYGATGSQLALISTNDATKGGLVGQFRDSGNNVVMAASPALAQDTWATVFVSLDGSTAGAGLVGGGIANVTNPSYSPTTTWNGTTAPPTLFSFWNGDNAHDFNGFVSEVLIFDHVLSPTDQATVESYLAAKAIPEPTSIALLAFGALGLFRRQRR